MSFKAGTDTEYTIVSMTVIFDDVMYVYTSRIYIYIYTL